MNTISTLRAITLTLLMASYILTFIAGCNRLLPWRASRNVRDLRIPQNHALAWYPRYLVSKDDYSRLFREKDLGSSVIDIIRRADVLRIIDIDGRNAEGFIWYRVRPVRKKEEKTKITEGWVLLHSVVRTYALQTAQDISRKLKRKKH